ncbi:MAG: zf-HC2 domain-containing protein [bacterium]
MKPAPSPERIVAGLACSDVLANLSRYLDRELPLDQSQRLEAHVRGCEWCERFGERFAAVVGALKRELAEPEPLDPAVSQRLAARLARELG